MLPSRVAGDSPPVGNRMSRGVATIHSHAGSPRAGMMRTRKIRHLPVVDKEGRLVGIVTDRDLRQVIFDPNIQGRAGTMSDALGRLTVRETPIRPPGRVRAGPSQRRHDET